MLNKTCNVKLFLPCSSGVLTDFWWCSNACRYIFLINKFQFTSFSRLKLHLSNSFSLQPSPFKGRTYPRHWTNVPQGGAGSASRECFKKPPATWIYLHSWVFHCVYMIDIYSSYNHVYFCDDWTITVPWGHYQMKIGRTCTVLPYVWKSK